MNYALIMCGGSGSRFWPKSRKAYPKQFLNPLGPDTMLQSTFSRIRNLIPIENIYVVTNKNYVDIIREQLPELGEDNLIVEPMQKETATCIGHSAVRLMKKDSEAVMVVLPSDHHIENENAFITTLQQGMLIAENSKHLITIGVKPTRPETAYGYIQIGKKIDEEWPIDTYKVRRFTEKPNKEKAAEFIEDGRYLWNSGMFIWKASSLLKQYKKHLPEIYESLKAIRDGLGTDNEFSILEEEYEKIEGISIDYGIMEKSKDVYVIECNFGWDDIGNWTAMERYMERDEWGNQTKGIFFQMDSRDCIVCGEKRLIAAIGVNDLIIVDTDDVLLICRRERDQDIKELLSKLGENVELKDYI
ncbi:mannose-1-phosphate guanylyltransferase [Lutispora saccharofermentans]|uniref:Mannose-1-phosphate guanylyltransferase n=1 Tax=Lutispora saccharofermentans TaxID=3024236 RepID=A0ABT1NEH7_9FIRM|nr:mannose-1-phosphate guanylyltransferase [Lutispora saccharofermentans]MCQ1529024.1 mannose-1-phosphate guanylyltransferase [Lutispora saccharofermentans]